MRVLLSVLEAPFVREEALRLRRGLERLGCRVTLGLGSEDRETWHTLVSGHDAMLVPHDASWWSSPIKRKQAAEAIRFGIPVYFFAFEPGPDPLREFGPEAHLLEGSLADVPGQVVAGATPAPARQALAERCLQGLAVGDAFGERFFGATAGVMKRISERQVSSEPWKWTDDTAQARCLVQCLARRNRVEGDALLELLVAEYRKEPTRGYGAGMHAYMAEVQRGVPWRRASREAFDGTGSFGNGAAMRVAPVGAYFFDQPARVAQQARVSAIVTHWHPEAQAGAEAVALAAAWAASEAKVEMLGWVRERLRPSKVRQGLDRALRLPVSEGSEKAAHVLGSGQEVSAWDTVPFVLWCAAHYYESYPEALWATVAGLGDRDTTCAMVGGIVALSCRDGVPREWLEATESIC